MVTKLIDFDLLAAQTTVEKTIAALKEKGYCLWRCTKILPGVIVILRDEHVVGYPQGYPVYYQGEMDSLVDCSDRTQKYIHLIKKVSARKGMSGPMVLPKSKSEENWEEYFYE